MSESLRDHLLKSGLARTVRPEVRAEHEAEMLALTGYAGGR